MIWRSVRQSAWAISMRRRRVSAGPSGIRYPAPASGSACRSWRPRFRSGPCRQTHGHMDTRTDKPTTGTQARASTRLPFRSAPNPGPDPGPSPPPPCAPNLSWRSRSVAEDPDCGARRAGSSVGGGAESQLYNRSFQPARLPQCPHFPGKGKLPNIECDQ